MEIYGFYTRPDHLDLLYISDFMMAALRFLAVASLVPLVYGRRR